VTSATANAIAERDNSPKALIERYKGDFATVLPSHIKPETFVRLAIGLLRRNEKLREAATGNPGSFLAALLDAARLGLEPGTEQYHLVHYKIKGRPTVQGIPGYQGEVELIYRAGAAASVVVELVRAGDVFVWRPGALDNQNPPRWHGPQTRPLHEADWFGERGALVGVYAYAEMTGGAVSKVVVMGQVEVYEARAKSASYRNDPETSPWTTDEPAMWLKTSAHRLRKWVPTSAEYRREVARASAEAQRVSTVRELPDLPPGDDVVDGEIVGDAGQPGDWPDVAQPGHGEPA
jgi:recombination protein RecT